MICNICSQSAFVPAIIDSLRGGGWRVVGRKKHLLKALLVLKAISSNLWNEVKNTGPDPVEWMCDELAWAKYLQQ